MARFSFIVLLFISLSCEKSSDCIDETQIQQDVGCAAVYDPVCGCNQVTYSNSCLAWVAGVKSWTEGECDN